MSSPSETIVYCAGPMFSPADLWEMSKIGEALENYGFRTFLAQRDGVEMNAIMKLADQPGKSPIPPEQVAEVGMTLVRSIFAHCVYQLRERCHATVFNMNGRVPDGGSIAETSAAYFSGKPILFYKNDPISLMNGMDNPLVRGLSYTWQATDDVEKIPETLHQLIDAYEKDFGIQPPPPLNRHLQGVLEFGEAVANLLPEKDPMKLIGELMGLAKQFPAWNPLAEHGGLAAVR